MSSVELDVEGDLPSDVRETVDRYRDQGGLLGVITYTLLYLETEDEQLAANAARIPTSLFVASSLHDDAIDESGADSGKSLLNYRVTTGDLFFTRTIEAVEALPADVDGETITGAIRAIGSGQLSEEATPASETLRDAFERVEQRGSVWGELAIAVVEASDRYPESQLEHLYTIATDMLFIFTILDDVADLHEDSANGVTTAPMLIYAAGQPDEDAKTDVETMLDSNLKERIEAVIEWREARIECAAQLFHSTLDDDEKLREALDRALTWYCESVCSVPTAETVPPAVQADIRTALRDETERDRLLAELAVTVPGALITSDRVPAPVDDLSAAQLAPVVEKLFHVHTIVESGLVTSVDEALSSVRSTMTAPSEDGPVAPSEGEEPSGGGMASEGERSSEGATASEAEGSSEGETASEAEGLSGAEEPPGPSA